MICCVSCVRVKNSFVWSFGHLVNGMVGVEANGIISSVIFEVATVSSQARKRDFQSHWRLPLPVFLWDFFSIFLWILGQLFYNFTAMFLFLKYSSI